MHGSALATNGKPLLNLNCLGCLALVEWALALVDDSLSPHLVVRSTHLVDSLVCMLQLDRRIQITRQVAIIQHVVNVVSIFRGGPSLQGNGELGTLLFLRWTGLLGLGRGSLCWLVGIL